METIVKEVEKLVTCDSATAVQDTKIEEQLLDALVIEELATNIDRQSSRLHLHALVKKIRTNSVPFSMVSKAVICPVAKSYPSRLLPVSTSDKYTPINTFAIDLGCYNSHIVTLYLDIPSVRSISKENICCHFTKSSFDLIVNDLHGKNYRLLKLIWIKILIQNNQNILLRSIKLSSN